MKTKPNRYFTTIGLLLFFLLCLIPSGQAQQGTPLPYTNAAAQLSLSWTFNANSPATGGFSVAGLRYWQLVFVPIGTVSSCGISVDSSTGSGFTTGGILSSGTIGSCAAAAQYVSNATTPTQLGQLTPTITGTGSVFVVLLGYVNNPGAASSSSSTIISPVDGSGYVEVNCKTGCSGGNPNGQATMANSAPVVLASNQSAIAATTQPTGFAAAIDFNQAVTTAAVALSSNASHTFSVCAQVGNTLPVFVGPSTVTTSGTNMGTQLQPGQCAGWQLSNTNLRYVIATATGQSVNVTGS